MFKVRLCVQGGGSDEVLLQHLPRVGETIELRLVNDIGSNGEASWFRVRDVVHTNTRAPQSMQHEASEVATTSVIVTRATGPGQITDAELMVLSALAIVDAEDCRAANMAREANGLSMAYGHVISEAADKLRAEMIRRGILKGGK